VRDRRKDRQAGQDRDAPEKHAILRSSLGRAGIGGSSRSYVHEKHDIVSFFLGKSSLLVLRMASCHAAKR
jgi:hypothetical protein